MSAEHDLWVGIDVGKVQHHACAVDRNGKTVWSRRVANEQNAIEALLAAALESGARPRWAIDITSGESALLTAVLLAAGQELVYVPGRIVNRMTSALGGESKTDAKDARVIAEIARIQTRLRAVQARDEVIVALGQLLSHRADLSQDWVRGVNRLRSMLASVFPGLEQALNLTTLAALRLVSRFTTPAQIRTAGEQTVQAELVELGVRRPTAASLARTALSAAVGQSIRLPGEELTASLIVRQAAKLAELHGELYELDKAIAAQFRRHQKAAIIESLPGFGPVVGAEFLVATGGELAWFPSSGHLAALAGLVPVARDSGRVSGNLHRPKRYNRRLHRAFYIAALSSLKGSEISRAFYERKRTERLTHVQALLALARRLVDVLWALLRDNRTFTVDPPRARLSAAA